MSPSRRADEKKFLTGHRRFENVLVVDEIFEYLIEQAASSGLLDLTYAIDSTDVRMWPPISRRATMH